MSDHIHDAVAVEVHDGDTFTADIFLDFYVRCRIKVRVRDLYAPELKDPKGMEAKNIASMLLLGSKITIRSYKDKQSFERWVCEVWLPNGELLKDVMEEKGYGGAGTGA